MDGKVQGGRKPKNWSPQQGRVWGQEDTSWSDVYGGVRGGSRETLSESMGMPRVTVRVCTRVRTHAWVCICECQACGCVKSMCDRSRNFAVQRKRTRCAWSTRTCPTTAVTPCPSPTTTSEPGRTPASLCLSELWADHPTQRGHTGSSPQQSGSCCLLQAALLACLPRLRLLLAPWSHREGSFSVVLLP